MTNIIQSETQWILVAHELSQIVQAGDLVTLTGPLGAGKTTLVKALGFVWGIENVTSPTFSLRQEYSGKRSLIHCDFYRLKNQDTALDVLPPDEDYSDKIVIVEWPEKVSSTLFVPFKNQYHIHIKLENGTRIIEW